ncbi:MAG: hybrid sensor histidine kinase/response regulator, partial [Mariprofundaceae bacterium]|nr:hybrid sensor histidine kinase/response regulator [Mariprofundaceae bacterium]
MEHTHHSLRYALTRTILIWAAVFFTLLGIIFMLTFDDVRNYTLQKVAEYRLNYQTQEFGKHLKEKDNTSIIEESDALVQDPEIAGIVLIDASGQLLHTSIHDERLTLRSFKHITPSSLVASVYVTPHLHLFVANIPE